jgi:hypothetical protein
MEEKEYKKKVVDLISPYLNNTNIDLTELAKIAQGITPVELLEILKLTPPIEKREISSTDTKFNIEPNPIDYDWRYDTYTIKNLANMLKSRHSNIGCFGVPSVFKELVNESNVILFDINPFLKTELQLFKDKVIQIDLNNEIVEGYEFDAIIMDPPWYNEYFSPWFKQSINNLKHGGSIYTSKYPTLVRPSAKEDWQSIIEEVSSFLSSEKKEIELLYETPIFERETFELIGLCNIGNWRRAELVSFNLKNKVHQKFDTIHKNEWKRYRFGNKTVSLKIGSDDFGDINVKSPYEDGTYTLKSVSQRHIGRNQVNFITSRNKSLIIEGTEKVDLFLQRLSQSSNTNSVINNSYSAKEVQALKIIHSLIGI